MCVCVGVCVLVHVCVSASTCGLCPKQYGFCAGKNLPYICLPFYLESYLNMQGPTEKLPHFSIFEEDKLGRNAKFHPCTTILCIDLLENLSLVRGRSVVSMTLLE